MCDPRDLGTAMAEPKPDEAHGPAHGYDPTLFLYEHCPGGTGLSERIFEQREALLARAHRLISACPCEAGCPACVGPVAPGSQDVLRSRKAVALELLSAPRPPRDRRERPLDEQRRVPSGP
jgi:DEAD/DEAH box helicase domain-containing protein